MNIILSTATKTLVDIPYAEANEMNDEQITAVMADCFGRKVLGMKFVFKDPRPFSIKNLNENFGMDDDDEQNMESIIMILDDEKTN